MPNTLFRRWMSPDSNDERSHPLTRYIPSEDVWFQLRVGDRLVRIYDHADAARNGYGVADFNPTLVKDRSWVRGRFSSTKKLPFSYLYLGQNKIDERIAILEYLDYRNLQRERRDESKRLISREDVHNLSFAYFTVTQDIRLVDVSNRPSARKLKAKLEVLQGADHRLTRKWARYVRSIVSGNEGLLYSPNRYGSDRDGFAVVLFSDHYTSSTSIQQDGPPVALASADGRNRLIACAEATNFMPAANW